jgi:cytochrome c peroxidase
MNAAFQEVMLWNGHFGGVGINSNTQAQWTAGTPKETNHLGYQGIETQAIAGLGVHRLKIDTTVSNHPTYRALFDQAFPDFPVSQRYTKVTAGLAIAAYERTLLAYEAPFQQWIRGKSDAMTKKQKEGALVFFGKGGCGECHTGPALNKMSFFAYGMKDLEGFGTYGTDPSKVENLGRGGFTKNPQDNFKFKVPQLYNLKDSPLLGHGASFFSVRQVVEYKNKGIKENSNVPDFQLAHQFKPLNLTDEEVDALVDFIENALYDANLMRFQPNHVYSNNCIPNNDPQSKIDLGCD